MEKDGTRKYEIDLKVEGGKNANTEAQREPIKIYDTDVYVRVNVCVYVSLHMSFGKVYDWSVGSHILQTFLDCTLILCPAPLSLTTSLSLLLNLTT